MSSFISRLHPLLPESISSDIHDFQADDFASKYFATKRSGMLRQKVPYETIMQWQKQPITAPLLVISRSLSKDAITTFKVIQHVMGERDRSVENAKPMQSTAATLNLPGKGRLPENGSATKLPSFLANKNGSKVDLSTEGSNSGDDKAAVLEEIRWMIQFGVQVGEMRDEIYSQLIKQLTKNPNQ